VGWFSRSPGASTGGEAERAGLFARLRDRLAKTRRGLREGLGRIFPGGRTVDAAALEELEELLITSDLGVRTATELIARLAAARVAQPAELERLLREALVAALTPPAAAAPEPGPPPWVVLVVGVNGTGKTTTIGKLAARHVREGRRVLLAAADTFRAAAGEQLAVWAERAGAELIRRPEGSDPAAVAFDAVSAALARGIEVVLVDTAGRLHTKTNLMEEIKKIRRSIAKRLPGAPHEVLLVLDATTGQNALSQARLFHEALGLTGIVLTKLDGTAKGGIAVAVTREVGVPLRYLGIGEAIEDLQDFDPEAFVKALLERDDSRGA